MQRRRHITFPGTGYRYHYFLLPQLALVSTGIPSLWNLSAVLSLSLSLFLCLAFSATGSSGDSIRPAGPEDFEEEC